MTAGPYRFIRHPICAAILFFIWAALASDPSLATIAAVLVATVAIGVRVAAEEQLVVQQYPDSVAYAARTKRIIPFVL